MADKIDIDKLAEYKKLLDAKTITQKEFNKYQKQYADQIKGITEDIEKVTIATLSLKQAEADLAEMFGDTLGAYEANAAALKQAEELYDSIIDSTKELTAEQIEQIELNYGNEEALVAEIAAMKAKKKAIDDLGPAYKKALKTSKPFFEDTAVKLGLLSKKGNKFAKTLGTMFNQAGEKGGMKGLFAGFAEAFNPLTAGISIISKVIEQTIAMMFAVDNAGSAFTKTTGFARKYDDVIADTNQRMRQFGITADDAQKAIVNLRQSLSQFDTLGATTRDNLIDLVSGLEKIGVSGADSSQMINSLNKSFDVSIDKATELTRDMAMSGEALGKTSSQMVKDYNKTLGTLAVYGTKSVKIFKDIAAMASAAGVEVNDMMGIANKFDTFADSAKTAAKMNAILGTSFSGNNLMMMDHDKRIQHVISGIQKTGVAFKNLDKFTQQAIATQLGFKDLDKARKILGMNATEYRRLQREQAKENKEQAAFNERIKAAVPILQELKLIMADFAVNMQEHLPTIRKYVMGFGDMIKAITPMGLLFTGLSSAFVGLIFNTVGLIGKIKLVEKFGGSAIKGLSKSIATGLENVSNAAAKSSPKLGALSISMGGIAAAIAAAGLAISGIVLSFAFLFKTLIDGTIALSKSDAGFTDVAKSMVLFGGAIFGVSKMVDKLAYSAAKLSATPAGLAMAGLLAGVGGLAMGIGAAMGSFNSTDATPKMNTKQLIRSAETIKGLSEDLRMLTEKRGELEQTFASIGNGLESASNKLTADIQSTIANVAVITTGHASGEMTNYTTTLVAGMGLGKLIDAINPSADSKGSGLQKGKAVNIQLDGPATTALLSGQQAKGHVSTN